MTVKGVRSSWVTSATKATLAALRLAQAGRHGVEGFPNAAQLGDVTFGRHVPAKVPGADCMRASRQLLQWACDAPRQEGRGQAGKQSRKGARTRQLDQQR